MQDFNIEMEADSQDINATVEAIREAWKCVPDFNLSQLLDEAMPAPMCELPNADIIEALNEFIIQNSK